MTSEELITKLRTAMTNGAFLTSLRENSGLTIASVIFITLADITPSLEPTLSPSPSSAPTDSSDAGSPTLDSNLSHVTP